VTSIKTVKSSLAIEGHSMLLEQISDILNGQPVIAPANDIITVKNAIAIYGLFGKLDAFNIEDILKAHSVMMKGLLPDAGRFRSAGVGLFQRGGGGACCSPHQNVSGLIANLLEYLVNSDDSLLMKSCIFHCEFEFIHSFIDGNCRIG
jgi:Fic family protein